MTNSLPDDLAIRLDEFYRRQGQDTTSLQPDNPYAAKFDNPGGKRKRVMLEALDPQLAADCQTAIGGQQQRQSLAYMAAVARGDNPDGFTGALAVEYRNLNPDFAAKKQAEAESNLLRKFDSMADQSRRRREGDKAVDEQQAKQQAEAEARAASYQRHVDQQKRIQARQQRMDAMNISTF